MAFPISPTNGQTYSFGGVTYTYNSTYGTWNKSPLSNPTSILGNGQTFLGNTYTFTGNINSTSTSTGTIVVTGGVGVSGNVYAGNVYSNGTVVATATAIDTVSNAVSVVSNALSVEIVNRVSADNALSVRIDTVSNTLSALSNLVSGVSNRLSVEINDRISAVNALSHAVSVTYAPKANPTFSGTASIATLNVSGDTVMSGNLTVNGTQQVVNSTTVTINDKNVVLGNNASTSATIDGGGIDIGTGPVTYLRYIHANLGWYTANNFGVGGTLTVGNITVSANNTSNIGTVSARHNTIFATTFNGTATTAQYADLAEIYAADQNYEPGTAVVFGGTAEITKSVKYADTRVAGIISTDPAFLMNESAVGLPVALRGRVPAKVYGPVSKGDLLVTAGFPGCLTSTGNSCEAPLAVIAKSLENSDDTGIKTIEVVLI
jgi:cytoskeletal protein CcmA (bactofilin family)